MSVNQLLSILWRRFWLVALGLVATVAGAVALLLIVPPRYEATASASIDMGQIDPVTGMVPGAARNVLGNLIGFIESQKLAAEVARRLNLASDPGFQQGYVSSSSYGQIGINEWIATTISAGVAAQPSDAGLTITYKSNSPVQAALFANTYMAAFEDMVLETKVASATQTATWLEPQTEKLRQDLEGARTKLVQYQKAHNLLAPGSLGSDTDSNPLVSTSGDLASTKAQLLALRTLIAAIDSGQGADQTSLLDSPVLSSLKSSIAAVNADLGRAKTDLGSNNPKVQGLVSQKRSLEDQVKIEIGNIRRTSQAKMQALENQIQALQSSYTDEYGKMINVQGQRDQLASMQREIAFRQEQLDVASKSAAAARMQGQLSFTNVQTLDNATPPASPSFPKKPLIGALSVGAGLALGVIFALIAEALDRRIRVVSDLDYATAAPLLGVVARSKGKRFIKPKTKGFTLSFPTSPR